MNLAPAQERKEGTGLDLAIALAVLAASGQAPAERVDAVAAVAELGLDGGAAAGERRARDGRGRPGSTGSERDGHGAGERR